MARDHRLREFPRYEISAYVDYASGDDVMLYHRIQNISLGGICITAPQIEEVGTTIDLQINFPDLGKVLEIRGEVVWANREPPMDMGIRYLGLDEEKRELLRLYISQMKK